MSAVSTSSASAPTIDEIFSFAREEIRQAAADLWPAATVVVEAHVPSVTGYVRRIRVDDKELFAKYSFLGVSLVSLLRGVCGGWPQTRRDQEAYVLRPDSLMEREAAQLRLLGTAGRPQVCAVAGVRRGVLFTEHVTGPTLADLLLQYPGEAAEMLGRAFDELHQLHQSDRARAFELSALIGERSISGTFLRKFNGLSGRVYVDRLGAERCEPQQRQEVTELLRRVVTQLHRLRNTVMPTAPMVLAYGDLKPEHIVFPDGASGQPTFIDPGLLRARATVDAAKFISRTVLLLASTQPGPEAGKQIALGIHTFTDARMRGLAHKARGAWLRELLTLWLMDTVNILTTYLSAPAALPLPTQGESLIKRAALVCSILDEISDGLARAAAPTTVWEHALAWMQTAAS